MSVTMSPPTRSGPPPKARSQTPHQQLDQIAPKRLQQEPVPAHRPAKARRAEPGAHIDTARISEAYAAITCPYSAPVLSGGFSTGSGPAEGGIMASFPPLGTTDTWTLHASSLSTTGLLYTVCAYY